MFNDSIEVDMFSSANDVWSAITGATGVYPKAMRTLYQQINIVDGDGYTSGSIRNITFGTDFNRVVKKGREKIIDIDNDELSIQSTFSHDGGLVPKLFDSFRMTITVVKSATKMKPPGCKVKMVFDYGRSDGNADITDFKNVMAAAYKDLDNYLIRNNSLNNIPTPSPAGRWGWRR